MKPLKPEDFQSYEFMARLCGMPAPKAPEPKHCPACGCDNPGYCMAEFHDGLGCEACEAKKAETPWTPNGPLAMKPCGCLNAPGLGIFHCKAHGGPGGDFHDPR